VNTTRHNDEVEFQAKGKVHTAAIVEKLKK